MLKMFKKIFKAEPTPASAVYNKTLTNRDTRLEMLENEIRVIKDATKLSRETVSNLCTMYDNDGINGLKRDIVQLGKILETQNNKIDALYLFVKAGLASHYEEFIKIKKYVDSNKTKPLFNSNQLRSIEAAIAKLDKNMAADARVSDGIKAVGDLINKFTTYLKVNMDKKMHKVTKTMEKAVKEIKSDKPKAAVKSLKSAEKKNEKLVKIDKNVRDPIIEAVEKKGKCNGKSCVPKLPKDFGKVK